MCTTKNVNLLFKGLSSNWYPLAVFCSERRFKTKDKNPLNIKHVSSDIFWLECVEDLYIFPIIL